MAKMLLRNKVFYNQLRTLHRSYVAIRLPITFNMYNSNKQIEEVLPEVIDCLMASPKIIQNMPEVGRSVKQLINYTINGGKQSRLRTVPFAYQMMEDTKYFTEEKLHTAQFLGWCLEMLQGYILAVDDIIDAATTRRGKTCWYLLPGVRTSAVNDCVLIYHCLMEVIEIKFGKQHLYTDLVKLINDAIMYTTIGQYLDYSSGYTREKNNIDDFTMERFNAIAVQKTSYYSFRLPMLAGLLLTKNAKDRDTTELSSICLEFGKILQIQNDHKDIYLDAAASGKAGTDIQEGKLSWISVRALELCNEAQRSIFKEYYGSKDPEHVKQIKQLYDELQIDEDYENFKCSFYDNLERRIRALHTQGETQFFLGILEAFQKQLYVLVLKC